MTDTTILRLVDALLELVPIEAGPRVRVLAELRRVWIHEGGDITPAKSAGAPRDRIR